MSPEESKSIAKEASREVLDDLFQRLGIDVSEVNEVQKDMHYLRSQREANEQISMWSKRVILATFISGAFSALCLGVKEAIHR